MNSEKIVVTNRNGKVWMMTPKQIEAAYRYREREYRKMDALNMINERLEWVDGDKDAFKREYGVSYDETVEDADYFVDEFLEKMDCNVSENEAWTEIFDSYFGE